MQSLGKQPIREAGQEASDAAVVISPLLVVLADAFAALNNAHGYTKRTGNLYQQTTPMINLTSDNPTLKKLILYDIKQDFIHIN